LDCKGNTFFLITKQNSNIFLIFYNLLIFSIL